MDIEEPVLESAANAQRRSNPDPVAEAAPAEPEHDSEADDDDDAASVGAARGAQDDADEVGDGDGDADVGPSVVPEAERARPGTPPATVLRSSDELADDQLGESVEAIEAAVASLALKRQSSAAASASAAAAAAGTATTAEGEPAPRPEAQHAAVDAQEEEPQMRERARSLTGGQRPEPASPDPQTAHAPASPPSKPPSAASSPPSPAPITPLPAPAATTPNGPFPWHLYPKHFFILSSSGKPVYSYHGDEASLVGLSALISALISVVSAQGDAVQHIRCGPALIVFRTHGPLYFVAASSLGEPATALKKQLELLHGQLVLVVTTGLERIIQRNPSYDVRSLLDGVGGVLSSLVQRCLLAGDAAYLLAAFRPLPVPAADRAVATELLAEALRQSGSGLYALLMAESCVMATCRARGQPHLHPDDVLLLANFVMCNNAYRHGHGEAFSPVCLPHFNADAFLHAHIHYLDEHAGMYLVFLAGSAEAFHQLSAARAWFEDQAGAAGLLQRLKAAAGLGPGARQRPGRGSADGSARQQQNQQQQHLNVLSVESLPRPLGGKFGHTPLWSYAVRFQALQQVAFSPPGALHRTPDGAARLTAYYTQLHSLLHSPAQPSRPNKLAWFADDHAVLLASRDRDMELYLVCDPLTDKATGMGLLEALRKHFGDKTIAADVTFPLQP